jgi:signal transduction histidine kinase
VRCDPGQLEQVLLNLVVNARDAIAADGTVTIRTAAATIAPGRPGWPAEVPPGEFVALTVTDTGVGMTDEIRARLFDPFFTTKTGRGTGLGLSTVRDIVRATGGHIEVESSPGWGTSVRVFWPVLPEAAKTPAGTPLRLVT